MRLKQLFKRFITRTLRVDILTLFLFLFCAGFICVIGFSYNKTHASILNLSINTVERVSAIIFERLKALIIDAEQVPKLAADLFTSTEDITPNNPYLTAYIYDAVEYDPNFGGFYIGTEEGNYIGASNVLLSGQKNYVASSEPLPEGTLYAFLTVDNTQHPAKIMVYYKNAQLETVGQEDASMYPFDPRRRLWYVGGPKDRSYHWTAVYQFYLEKALGVSASVPIINDQNQRIGVAEVDLSFNQLSQFLAEQKIGKGGKAFILTYDGRILVAPEGLYAAYAPFISRIFSKYRDEGQTSFIFEDKGIKYLVHIQPTPLFKEREWLITVIVPLSDFFAPLLNTQRTIVLLSGVILIIVGVLVFAFSKRISAPIIKLSTDVDRIAHLDLEKQMPLWSNIIEIRLIANAIATLRTAIRSFVRYVPKNVVKMLIDKEEELVLGGEKKEITIFFTDIAGFTALAEHLEVEEVTQLLAEYFDGLTKIILEHEGTIDKFIGDIMMVLWGAPEDMPDHAARACKAALLCRDYFQQFNQRQKEKGKPQVESHIIINSGIAIVGNMGTVDRINYTAIGDIINTAAHLRPMNKLYHAPIILTEETYKRVKDSFNVRALGTVEVKGKKDKMTIYELL